MIRGDPSRAVEVAVVPPRASILLCGSGVTPCCAGSVVPRTGLVSLGFG